MDLPLIPSTSSSSALYRTYGVLGSVIFIRLSLPISVKARFSSSHWSLELYAKIYSKFQSSTEPAIETDRARDNSLDSREIEIDVKGIGME